MKLDKGIKFLYKSLTYLELQFTHMRQYAFYLTMFYLQNDWPISFEVVTFFLYSLFCKEFQSAL